MLIIKRCKPKTEKQSGIALWKQQSAVLLAALLLVFQCTLLATPTYAATTNQESNIIQRFFERLFPPSVSPVPEPKKNDSKKPSVLSEKDPISPKAQPLDLTDLEQRIASLENQLIANTQYSSIPTSTLDTATGTNLIRNSSFESSRGNKPRQWNYIYDSTENNTKQSPEGIRSGKYGLKFQGQTSTSGQGIDLGISQPDAETTPQRTYTLSAYVKHTNVNNDTDVRKPTTANNTTIRLGFWDKYNNKPGPMKTILLSGTKDWYRISTTVETTGIITDYANWYPMIEVRGLKSGAAVYIDDVQLEEGSVLTLFDSAVAGWSSFGSSLGDGSVLATTTGTLYPAENGIGSLGTTSNRFRDLYLSKATINENGDLNLEGSASVGSLTVNGETNLKGSLKLNNLAYTFPATQGAENTILINDGTGALTWGTFGAASVTPDSLDFAQFVDNMTLDADSSINLNNSGTPHDLRFYNSNSGAEMLFLDGSTGRVGIGTAEPIQALDVSGSVNVSDAYLIRGNPILKTSGGSSTAGNILLGLYAGNSDVDSVANVFIGYQAGYSNTVGYSNTFIGRDAGYASTGNQNTFIGRDAGINLASGGNNTLLGHSSGRGVTSGTGYTLLGTGANAETGLINATAIGYQAKVATSNSMVLGCVSGCTGGTTVSVGIGTTAPAYRLDVIGTARFAPTLDSISGLFVNSSGNVGIGTSSPTSALDVAGTTWLRGAAGGTSGLYVDSSGNVGIGTTLPASLLDVAGTTWLRGVSGGTSGLFVNSSGNVGIGTINPGAKLHISNTSPTAGGTELIRLSADYAHLGVVGRGGFLSFWDTSSIQKEISRISSVVTSGNRAGFTFSTYNGSSAIEKMRIDGNGNVGIGTTAPVSTLDVAGTSWLRGTVGGTSGLFVDSSGNVGIGTTSPTQKLQVAGNIFASGPGNGYYLERTGGLSANILYVQPSTSGYFTGSNVILSSIGGGGLQLMPHSGQNKPGLSIGAGGATYGSNDTQMPFSLFSELKLDNNIGITAPLATNRNNIYTRYDSGSYNLVLHGRSGISFDVNGGIGGTPTTIEGMRITSSGNLGIGTTAPAYKLDVNGDINTTGDILNNGAAYTHPDYVFEPDYDLMPLANLKQYVSINRHLPGVPSAEDVQRDGVKLFEQTRLNLEKTEEAYLYLFDLDDRLNELSLSLPQQPPDTATLAIAEDFELDMVALNAELEALKDQMLTLDERLEIVEEQTDEIASMSAALKELKAEVELLKSTQTIASVSATLAESDLAIAGTETVLEELTVTGKANVFDLAVLKSITTGLLNINGLVCENQDTCRATIATLNGTLALQPEATGNLEFMAGKVVIDTNGDMKIDGKLTVGEVVTEKIKSKSVETKSVVLGDDVTMTSGTSAPTGTCQTGTMYVWNDKTKDEALIFVCTKKKWQEVTTATPVSNTSPTPTISVSPTPTPSDVIHIPSSDGGTAVPASQTE